MSEHLMQFFAFEHLPPHLADVSRPFAALAHHVTESLPRNPERTTALRKLLEAKDCAVRALLSKDPEPPAVAPPEAPGAANTRMPIVLALREHGAGAFDFIVLATLPTEREGKLAEHAAIAARQPAFNACSGPSGDHERTAETRSRVSEANRRAWAEGRRSRTVSAETRAKMSAARRGVKHGPMSEATKAKIAASARARSAERKSQPDHGV
jgi:hypothetical protein